ncbi:ribonuclease H-like domain-containing protein [Tanacetum coccineum]
MPAKFDNYVLNKNVKYDINSVVNYSNLSIDNFVFTNNLNKFHEPTTFAEAANDPRWIEAMNQEMEAFNKNNTWEITDLPKGRKVIGSKWIFKVKYKSDGDVERFKAKLVAKGFGQKEGIDYEETFSHVVKIVTIGCLLTMAVSNRWHVYQLDVNNAFLYGELAEDMYMHLPEGYFTDNDNKKIMGKLIYLTITRPDITFDVHNLSQFMHAPCQSHLKLAFHVLRYLKGSPGTGISFKHCNDLSLSAYVNSDWAKWKITQKSVIGYVVYMGMNLVSWKSKKHYVIAKSSAKSKYRAMNSATGDVLWIINFLGNLKVKVNLLVPISCDSSYAIQIATNLVFHERTKHFEIDLYFLREKVSIGLIKTLKIKYEDNVVDGLTKGLSIKNHKRFCEYLQLLDVYHK